MNHQVSVDETLGDGIKQNCPGLAHREPTERLRGRIAEGTVFVLC